MSSLLLSTHWFAIASTGTCACMETTVCGIPLFCVGCSFSRTLHPVLCPSHVPVGPHGARHVHLPHQ